MRKQYPLMLLGAVSCIASTVHAQPGDWMRGGPVSDALVQAIEAHDEAALREAWSGKIYELTGRYKGTAHEIDSSRLFEAVADCNRVYKVDGEEKSRAAMTWDCPERAVVDDECQFENVNIGLRVLKFADESEALFLAIGQTYNDDCGPTRPPSAESILSGTK